MDIHRTHRLPFFERQPLRTPSIQLYWRSRTGKLLEKAWSALKFFIHYNRPLAIILISLINSLQCSLSSCSELVLSIISANKHLSFQSLCSEIYIFIAIQATQVYYKASKHISYVALSASSLGRIVCCLAHGVTIFEVHHKAWKCDGSSYKFKGEENFSSEYYAKHSAAA